MRHVFIKTFGGLSASYYFRQVFFSTLLTMFIYAMLGRTSSGIPTALFSLLVVNTLLYPYSRFVYESIMDFIVGDNLFVINAVLMLITKFLTMLLCWSFAVFIAPVGLVYLYFHHSKDVR